MYHFDALDLILRPATTMALAVHVRPPILTSWSHIPSPQGSPGDAKIDALSSCVIRTMTEVKLYFISRGDIMNNVDKRVIDIIRREAEFKATYYDGRFDGREESRPRTRK